MSYKAIVCKLENVREHPNADRLQIASALGYSIIVGKDAKDGDVGILFPSDGKLSHEMCMANNLYRKHPVTNEPMGGYFESKGRVKAVKLRGQISDGFFTGLESVAWAGANKLKVGDEFDTINDNVICQKYYTPATIKAMKSAAKKYKKPWWVPSVFVPMHRKYVVNRKVRNAAPTFEKHFDTPKLRQYVHMIPPNMNVYISSKMHGTSARSGYVPYDDRNLLQRIFKMSVKYRWVKGTRNVTHNPNTAEDNGYYSGTDFRQDAHSLFVGKLNKDEIVYYEIVGYCGEATKIMPDHSITDKELKDSGFSKDDIKEFRNQFGENISYVYGCEPGNFEVYVYRITQNGEDLSNAQMIERCEQLDVKVVPQLGMVTSDEDLMKIAERYSREADMDGQLREGVCLRLEDNDKKLSKIVKYKSFLFCLMEGIKKNSDTYIDMEEVS